MKKIFIYILIVVLTIPSLAKAQITYTLLEPVPCIPGTSTEKNCVNGVSPSISLEDYIGYVFKFAIAISAFLAVIMIIWGGFEIMLSEAVNSKLEGKKRVYDALTGLVMVLASYLILQTIDPRLVEIDTTIKPLIVPKSSLFELAEQSTIDLTSFSNTAKQEITTLVEENKQNEEKIKALQENEDNLTEDQATELQALEDKVTENNVTINTAAAEQTGYLAYQRAANVLMNTNPSDDDKVTLSNYYDPDDPYATSVKNIKDGNGKYPVNTKNVIRNQYNQEINKIIDTDPEKAQLLLRQEEFYINLIASQAKLSETIEAHGTPHYVSGGIGGASIAYYTDNTTELNARLAAETKNLLDKNVNIIASTTGINADGYKTILQSRIDQINEALKKKVK